VDFRERLKDEIERLGVTQAEAARAAGLRDSQGIRDVLAGRKRLTAELLAALAQAGVDVLYVLIGRRSIVRPGMSEDEIAVFNRLVSTFWNLSDETRRTALDLLSALSLKDVQAGTARGVRKAPARD
jgi:transcriptional regulator with XRE-family HTH domain